MLVPNQPLISMAVHSKIRPESERLRGRYLLAFEQFIEKERKERTMREEGYRIERLLGKKGNKKRQKTRNREFRKNLEREPKGALGFHYKKYWL